MSTGVAYLPRAMELRLAKEQPLVVPKINISAETLEPAPVVVVPPVKVAAPVKAPARVDTPIAATIAASMDAPTAVPALAPAKTSPALVKEEKPSGTPQQNAPAQDIKEVPKGPPKLNDRQSHILLYPCQKCGQPTAFCYLRTVEFEKKESQRYCVVCFDRHERAKKETTNVASALTSGSTFKKRVTKDAMKLIGLFVASIIAICVVLFFSIRNHSKGKQPSGATIAGATDASGQPAKPGDKPLGIANGQPANSTTHPGSKKPGEPNAPAKTGAIATNGNISDAKAKTAATAGATGSKATTTGDAKTAVEADAKKSAERIEKAAALAEKENSAKIAKSKDPTDTDKKPSAKDDTVAKTGDPKKPGEKDTAKTGEKDPAKPGDPNAEPAKTASATDTIKQIEKLIPTDDRKAAPKTQTEDGEKKNTGSAQDDKSKDPASTDASAKAASNGGRSRPSDTKPTISQEKAVELNGKLSKVAAKVAPKLKSASTIATRITDVATRFAPKTDLASGPLERTASRQNDTAEQGDINLDGGTGEDAWDALQREIAESDPSVKLTNSTTAAGAPGTNAPNSPYTIPGLQPRNPGKTSGTATPSNARSINPNTLVAASTSKKITSPKSTDIVLNSLTAKPGKTATLNTTDIIVTSLTDPTSKKQTQLNSTEIILNSQTDISSEQKNKLAAQKRPNNTEIKLHPTEIMLSPFTEVPARKAQLNNTEIVLNSLTGVASEQAKLNSTTILLRPIVEPNGASNANTLQIAEKPALSGGAATPPSPKIIVNRYVALPDAFKDEVIILTLSADALFDNSPSALCAAAEDHLNPIAEGIKKHPELPVLIRCYTDNIGTLKENLTLSQKRAEAVRNWLVKKTGIPAKSITVIGMGASEPIASNTYSDGTDNFQGRARNRRITITTPTLMPTRPATPPTDPALMVKAAQPATKTMPHETAPAPTEISTTSPAITNTDPIEKSPVPTPTAISVPTPAPVPAATDTPSDTAAKPEPPISDKNTASNRPKEP